MGLKAGIVGLPNVGKSTLFGALCKNQVVDISNYPFATINPNIGVVKVPDARLELLAQSFKPKHVEAAIVEYVDIAGLIKGASAGEGLGNAFLANIRDTDLIVMVVRCFEDKNVLHVANQVDPVSDIETVNLELILADQELVKKHLAQLKRKAKALHSKETQEKLVMLHKISDHLASDLMLSEGTFTQEELRYCNQLNLLTHKPVIIVANIDEQTLLSDSANKYLLKIRDYCQQRHILCLALCAKLEYEMLDLDSSEKQWIMNEYNLQATGLEIFIQESYKALNLATFFTAGPQEVRAWTFHRGWLAPQCAGVIHTDFEKKFIMAEVYNYEDFEKYRSEQALKEQGLIRKEGKRYALQDGDICFFRFGG